MTFFGKGTILIAFLAPEVIEKSYSKKMKCKKRHPYPSIDRTWSE
jgi:hypothetical protein